MEFNHFFRFPLRSTAAFLFLVLLGLAGNYFHLSLFYGLDFLFGSIAVLLVTCFWGTTWGGLASILVNIYTYYLWSHPFAIIIFTFEILFISFFFHRKHSALVLLDGIYWLLIGMPLALIFYWFVLGIDSEQVVLVVLKQTINGIFNASIAGLIVTYLPLSTWIRTRLRT